MRIGLVNDQPLALEALRMVVLSDSSHEIAWTATDGRQAVERCESDRPDVVLMDLVMPVMNGAEATRRIMQVCPCPVLVVTATVSGNYGLVCEALGNGAFDAICTPTLAGRSPSQAGASLLAKLEALDRIRQGKTEAITKSAAVNAGHAMPTRARLCPLVAIGASTGGPQALEQILSAWPAGFPAAVLVVQHIAADFAPSLACWLQDRSKLTVRVARPGDYPEPATVLIAATNDHMVMEQGGSLIYRAEPLGNPFRPSVDVFFQSLRDHWTTPSVAVILTGIGRDGAEGLLKLRQAGWHTVSQDEATSVVYGMPQAAAQLGAAKRILPLSEVADHILRHVTRSSSS